MFIIFIIAWNVMFGSRSRSTKKSYKKNQTKVKETLSISDIHKNQTRYKSLSNALNIIPFGRLDKVKRERINSLLTAIKSEDKVIKIAEEVHCKQWYTVGFYILLLLVLTFAISPVFSVGLFACPIPFMWPIWSLKSQVVDEEYELDTEFRNFFNIYYVQYRRIGNNVRLLDVVRSYMTVAPPGMQLFCNRLITDLSSGETVALRNLDRRYIKNPEVHRFCAIAQMVSNGDANSEKVVDSFREQLNRKKLMRQRRELNKNKQKVETVTTVILYAVCIIMMIVVFVFMAIG
jgi:hypothetical protein